MITNNMLSDALRYIGMPKNRADEEIKDQVTKTFEVLEGISAPKFTYRKLTLNKSELSGEDVFFENTSLIVKSRDLAKLLEHCEGCYILAVTLGQAVDRQIHLKQKLDMLEAVVLDACSSVLIDKVCDDIEIELMEKLEEGKYLTMRFSPGYGDVPLDFSSDILSLLEASKRIGLTLTKSHMLLPSKSVTAIIGISNKKENRQKSCASCNLVKQCMYRKRGERCGV